VCDDCTACMGDKYWSHRKVGGDRGSMAAMIELR
jgi:copper oxidase (laccase) domain-containing protein